MIGTNKIEEILAKVELRQGIEKYKYIMNRFREVDVSKDASFRKTFENFYVLSRYPMPFREDYFAFMERNKSQTLEFAEVLSYFKAHGSLEASFSSKLIHTINPSMPIWDKIVTTDHFGYKLPYPKAKEREQRIVNLYEAYCESFMAYMESEEGKSIIRMFDEKFPDSGLTDVKKVDFVLWQDR